MDTHGASVVGFAFTELLNLWGLIEQQYDLMVKYDTALRLGKAEAEQVPALRPRRSQAPHLPSS
ncbi:hypothetical protein OG828_08845 [Streptomyces sp. NBC_00457]|uniref:hypothetical protein n=1 Tax=Streptomyces sp. NBC_00457 TaxID=2975748 RepID=UPI002E213635